MVFQKLTAEQKQMVSCMDIDPKKKASIRCCMMRGIPHDHVLNEETVIDTAEKPKRIYKKKSIIINEEPVVDVDKPKPKRTYKKKEPKAEEDSASIVII